MLLALGLTCYASCILAQGVSSGQEYVVKLNSVDFVPEDGKSYDLRWPGPPRRPWTDADKRTFLVTATLSAPAPEDFSFAFSIKENKTWDVDPVLGSVILHFGRGSTSTQARFWLVCGRKGRIQGELGRDFDGYGNVYLYPGALVSDQSLDNWQFEVTARRIQHAVQCK
ncbi:MAG TPA: hypothetical protein PKN13_11975 [Accumulibacter sp.]|nr:hypothetical protein [Accumulibacter sp.]HMW18492.1 hypothetical protein [Accumulibacter sp.]HMX23918.1 hypothetical protein [Accumulibacter sp.]HNC18538.1 hypothetical protein [Accumulibacter sp.]HND81658.1 hypothetical protein [Accumulibacter sp.]